MQGLEENSKYEKEIELLKNTQNKKIDDIKLENKMKLEEKLVSLRKAKGLSQMKLAEMMNVSRPAISRWEVGAAVPSTDNLKYLGRLYDVP